MTIKLLAGFRIEMQLTPIEDLNKEWKIPIPAHLENALEKRKREYLLGRYCAIKAIEQLGLSDRSIPGTDSSGRPIWPKNLVGSITHSNNFACALVGSSEHFIGIGIDIELVMQAKTARRIANHVLTTKETELFEFHQLQAVMQNPSFPTSSISWELFLTLIFSIKESGFKALSLLSDHLCGFSFMTVTALNFEKNYFILEIDTEKTDLAETCSLLKGEFQINGPVVYTQIVIPKDISEHNSTPHESQIWAFEPTPLKGAL